MTTKKITISGAGLVGSLLGVLLGQRGFEVTLYERRPDPRGQAGEGGRSINLALAARGIHALEQAGLMDEVRKILVPMRGRMLHFESGEPELMLYGQRPEEVIYSVSRRDLNALMIDAAVQAADVNVHFGQTLEQVSFEDNELTLRDVATDQVQTKSFELLIGADGAGSRTRRALMSKVGGESAAEFLDHDYKELEIPAGPGDRAFQMEREALHIWPRGGYMLIALPNQGGSFTVTLFLPKEGGNSFASLTDAESVQRFFAEQFPDALALMPELVEDFFGNPAGRLGTVRCAPWHLGDQCLVLGDASHAIVPFHGQGMNAGFEDCSELIRLLDSMNGDWKSVLPEFDRLRKPNAEAIADMALENYVTMRASVADPKFALKKQVGFELEQKYPEKFIPRYSQVMFHHVPYAEAFRQGKWQAELLNELVQAAESVDDVDWEFAAQRIEKEWG